MDILIVEDDDGMAEALQRTLSVHGFQTYHVGTGAEALEQLTDKALVLLDLGLPDLEGHEVCRRIRESSCVPVIALSGRTEELDRVMALHMGADDFITKPFSRHELVARMRAVLRRADGCVRHATELRNSTDTPSSPAGLPGPSAGRPDAPPDPAPASVGAVVPPPSARTPPGADRPAPQRAAQTTLLAGPIRLDPRARKVFVHDEEVRVTRKEFDLLSMLLEEPGTVVERQDIMARVWDENWFGSTRTLDVHVGSLRTKLGTAEWIETVRGVGYRLAVPTAAQG